MLGTLFRSRDFIKNGDRARRHRHALHGPPDGAPEPGTSRTMDWLPASDLKANFLGHINRIYGKTAALPAGGLKGDYGFIVE